MGFLDFLNPVFDLLFGWLLPLPPFWSILILSFIMSLIIILITKYTTDQDLMKHLKEESRALQKQIRELKDNPERQLEVQKKHMESSMTYMKHSFRPMLFTFLPIILIFGWISAHLAYEPIRPGQEFSVRLDFEKGANGTVTVQVPEGIGLAGNASKEISDGNVIFTFKAEREGRYEAPGIIFSVDGRSYSKEVWVTNKREYVQPLKRIKDTVVSSIETVHNTVKVINIGTFGLGWIWAYIIFSILFSSVLKKLLKVY